MHKKFVIIGGDAAGMSAASKIRRLQPEAELVVFEKGKHISFAACGIPYWLGGVVEDENKLQVLTPEIAREKRNIDVRIGHEVLSIMTQAKQVKVKDHATGVTLSESYDKLLIATGARAKIPNLPGLDLDGVFTLRNLSDGQKIKSYLENRKVVHATIVGAGYIGLEMAENLRHLGMGVTLVAAGDQIARQFDKGILEQVETHIVEQQVDLRLETIVTGISKIDGHLEVATDKGKIATDLVILSKGVLPNSELAAEAGISLGSSRAILTNAHMQTSDPDIYAAGDCAEHKHLVTGDSTWVPLATSANRGGRIAGENMAGSKSRFTGILGTVVIKVFEYTLAATGLSEKEAHKMYGDEAISTSLVSAGNKAHYYPGSTPLTIKLVVDVASKRLLGAQMVGKSDVAKRMDVLATAITAKMSVEEIGMLDLTYAPPFAPVYDPIHIAANVANK